VIVDVIVISLAKCHGIIRLADAGHIAHGCRIKKRQLDAVVIHHPEPVLRPRRTRKYFLVRGQGFLEIPIPRLGGGQRAAALVERGFKITAQLVRSLDDMAISIDHF
jgi:hypothetical protein